MATMPVVPTADELGAVNRVLSVYITGFRPGAALTPLQTAAIDDLVRFLMRAVTNNLDRSLLQSIKSKVDVYYGVSSGTLPPTS
jgi:hypothetical protein